MINVFHPYYGYRTSVCTKRRGPHLIGQIQFS
jgi:hypothetical protein